MQLHDLYKIAKWLDSLCTHGEIAPSDPNQEKFYLDEVKSVVKQVSGLAPNFKSSEVLPILEKLEKISQLSEFRAEKSLVIWLSRDGAVSVADYELVKALQAAQKAAKIAGLDIKLDHDHGREWFGEHDDTVYNP